MVDTADGLRTRADATEKITGQSQYTGDLFSPECCTLGSFMPGIYQRASFALTSVGRRWPRLKSPLASTKCGV
jgi:hypothetical protein